MCDAFKRTPTTIKAYRRKFRSGQQPPPPKRQPQFTSLTFYQQQSILNHIEHQPFITFAEIKRALNLDCQIATIRSFLLASGFRSFFTREDLLISEHNLNRRITFAEKMSMLSQSLINRIVFADEKTLYNTYSGRVRVIRRRGHQNSRRFVFRRNPQSSCKINLFGFITSGGCGDLFVFNGRTDSELFVNYLETEVLPSMVRHASPNFILAIDNATIHYSNLSLEYLLRANVNLLCWPAQTPIFNIIENLWSILQRRTNELFIRNGRPRNVQQLADDAFTAWRSIQPEIVRNLYRSFLPRLETFLTELNQPTRTPGTNRPRENQPNSL